MDTIDSKEYLRRLEFEHELIGRRVGWLLTSQSILFAAYALTLDAKVSPDIAKLVQRVIPSVGVWVSVVVLLGVFAGALAKCHTWRDFRRQKRAAGDSTPVYWGVRTYVTMIGLIPDVALPVIFLVAWRALRS